MQGLDGVRDRRGPVEEVSTRTSTCPREMTPQLPFEPGRHDGASGRGKTDVKARVIEGDQKSLQALHKRRRAAVRSQTANE